MALTSTSRLKANKNNLEITGADLGTILDEIQAKVAALATLATANKAAINATLTKLDADAGVTDTNYSATNAVAAANVSV